MQSAYRKPIALDKRFARHPLDILFDTLAN